MNVTENWRLRVDGGEIVGRPAVLSDGDVIVGTLQGSVYRINPISNGTVIWKVYAGSIVGAPVVDQDDTIYFGSGDRNVWALTPDGMTKWQYLTQQPLMTAPLLLDMMYLYDGSYSDPGVVIGGLDGILYKLNLDGTEAWTFQTGGQIRGAASVTHDGKILFGSTDMYLYCISAKDGSLQWKYNAYQEITSKPLVQDVSIVFGTRQNNSDSGRIIALKFDGTWRWEISITSSVEGEPIEDPETGTVYAASNDGKIFAIQADGAMQWRYVTGGSGGVCGDYSKISDENASPTVSGKCSFSELGAHGATSPCFVHGMLVTSSANKFVYGLGLDGSLLWKFGTRKRIKAPVRCLSSTDSFGRTSVTVLAASNDRYLYSIDVSVNPSRDSSNFPC
ncbi:hypothetical protein GUITHDRAFT_118480 [Guillardia theta CCMP2712]|uniref:Pyrrolo-quinoline quinone repeat domain-containing protein n=1 Tax=Guillardia theta (strain CCMP2712) TaxID=905079 RepID=L1IGH8_GUITC|nr:hypothetical protein GUITHDRAFT_118480 [Guillardia theta CCMP2712]EKX35356.1 hypothetical protein GUITHDRAFT_118480 [Guillardia theta CCMP2712]|eukprot:XP_005822336.1 hypothetical protein GUITHDRAFT_118480 [Guillardia theta CCMP2712]